MDKKESQKKGDDLEDAIAFIERILMEKNPAIQDFTIQQKKKILNGMHEIDILVEAKIDNRVEKYLFECKNWDKKKVDKNEVIIVAAKVADYNATKGLLVGKQFTKFAKKQSEMKGVELIVCKDIPNIALPSICYTEFMGCNYGVVAFQNGDKTNRVIFEDNPNVIIGGIEQNIFTVCEKYFSNKIENLKKVAEEEISNTANEANVYEKIFYDELISDQPIYYQDHSFLHVQFAVQVSYWFSPGKFEYCFDIEKRRKILKRVLTFPGGREVKTYFNFS